MEVRRIACPGLPGRFSRILPPASCAGPYSVSLERDSKNYYFLCIEGNHHVSERKKIGLAVTGSFCTFDKIEQAVQTWHGRRQISSPSSPLMSRPYVPASAAPMNTSEGSAVWPAGSHSDHRSRRAHRPQRYLDILLIAPCTGNTLAKLANGITDTPVLMAAKAHLRNEKPLVISLSTNDAMGMNLRTSECCSPAKMCISFHLLRILRKKALFPDCENRAYCTGS